MPTTSPLRRRLRWLRNRANKALVQVQNEYLRREKVWGHPFQLTLEPGNVCNLKCPLCPTPFREKRLPTGMLKLDNATSIMDAFPYTVQLVLSNWGEPFLNKQIFDIIKAAKERDLQVRLESNFTLFDEEKCHKLVDSKLDTLVIALDGATQESYEVYRVGGVIQDIFDNIAALRRVQKERNDFHTQLVWKMVVNRYNQHEVEQARAMAAERGMKFEQVTIWAPDDQPEWLPVEKESATRNQIGGPQKCHNLWQAVSVNFNGDVFPCCSEFAPSDKLVNVLEAPFDPVWNSESYRERRRVNKGPVNCEACHGDRDTHWYKTWMAPGEKAREEARRAAAGEDLRDHTLDPQPRGPLPQGEPAPEIRQPAP